MEPRQLYQNVPTPLSIAGVSKSFKHNRVLQDITLDVQPGEFVCLLGPSGCGKTTLLRIIAGLERQDEGRIFMGKDDISFAPPQERDYGILFQSYALFPNLTVEKNVAYGLARRQLLQSDVQDRAMKMLELVGLDGNPRAYPDQLSGGQQQRVAMARALAPSPTLLLLDEPMSALDAKVRERLRGELRQLQKSLGITTVMVTHDQDEAMVMADRIAVMNGGCIEQFDTPENIYYEPATPFVANFIGHSNWLASDGVRDGTAHVAAAGLPIAAAPDQGACLLFFRPETVAVRTEAAAGYLPGQIVDYLFLGSRYRLSIQVQTSAGSTIVLADMPRERFRALDAREPVWLAIDPMQLKVFEGRS
ncbi:putative 2-aminoethylphosphonate ABC transporter ATP-binding protein [Verticiella sediminum]|uniref:Putative 2-aminoethylphosphonate ABC transporter ATP-binding protein n=1 Tax=Verticiella sediminum TaxID=1247510 RepID=A0A556B2D8_9BURK|nr:putative 2-aminoethylphosphonate ABC transporter ATP-binding protein [Verticiella sediminum]TSH98945.1 putative 2-aminoethylphosphonate ABC transporter ATP-binding protein [Verticiella sediminum]